MRFRTAVMTGVVACMLLATTSADAGRRRACRLWNYGCGDYGCYDEATCSPCGLPLESCCEPAYQDVECTVMVPQTVYETRRVVTTQYKPEVRQRTVTVYRQVPRVVTRQVQYTVCDRVQRERTVPYVTCRPVYEEKQVPYTYCEPVYEQRTATRTVHRPVYEDVQREYTVMVPHTEWHTGVRKVCQMQEVTQTRTVCVDQGHWEEQCVSSPCGPACGPGGDCCHMACRPMTCRVWRPNLVEKQVPYTVCRPVYVDQEYRYCTTSYKPETRTCTQRVCRHVPEEVEYNYTVCRMVQRQAERTVRVCRYVQETHERVVHYTELVPRTETREEQYTVYDCVPEERTVDYTVCVPVPVEREVKVAVCKMVPQTVVRRVPVPCNTCNTGGCY